LQKIFPKAVKEIISLQIVYASFQIRRHPTIKVILQLSDFKDYFRTYSSELRKRAIYSVDYLPVQAIVNCRVFRTNNTKRIKTL